MHICPLDKKEYETAREAILCWRYHMPDLFRYYKLSEIGREIGISRERVRQIANSLDEIRRKQPRVTGTRGKQSEILRKRHKKR